MSCCPRSKWNHQHTGRCPCPEWEEGCRANSAPCANILSAANTKAQLLQCHEPLAFPRIVLHTGNAIELGACADLFCLKECGIYRIKFNALMASTSAVLPAQVGAMLVLDGRPCPGARAIQNVSNPNVVSLCFEADVVVNDLPAILCVENLFACTRVVAATIAIQKKR